MEADNRVSQILIVEDDLSFRLVWKRILEGKFPNAQLEWATNATRALSIIVAAERAARPFDMLITDIFLSGDNTGVDLVREVSPFFKGKIILVSGADIQSIRLSLPKSDQITWFNKSELLESTGEKLNLALKSGSKNEQTGHYRPVVLVTGCRTGIGQAIARRLSKEQKYRIVVTGRPNTLAELQKEFEKDEQVLVRPLDVTDRGQIAALVNEVHCLWGGLDILINNAGVCFRSVIEHMDEQSEMEQLKTNYLGPMALIRYVIPAMRERGRGKIINISSVSGIMAMPTMASYSASKHALEAASEALWHEMLPFGINVSVVRPGFVSSNSFQHIRTAKKAKLSAELAGPYSDFYDFIKPFVARFMRMSRSSPESIAEQVLRCIQKQNPPLWVNATADAHVFSIITKFVPNSLLPRLLHSLLPGNKKWGKSCSRAEPRRLAA